MSLVGAFTPQLEHSEIRCGWQQPRGSLGHCSRYRVEGRREWQPVMAAPPASRRSLNAAILAPCLTVPRPGAQPENADGHGSHDHFR